VIAEIVACRTELHIPHAVACRALDVSESWFYKHKDRPPTVTVCRRRQLDAAVVEVFTDQDGEYGSPRVRAELIERPEFAKLSVNTVAARMRACGLYAKKRPVRRCLTRPDASAFKFNNLLRRNFDPPEANLAWCGDITEIVTWDGKLYLATVIDLWSRRMIGFAIAEHCRADLVCDALRMAIAARGGQVAGVIMHTDRGSQYTAGLFTGLCRRHHIVQSMSRAGSCHDNAAAESWFATLKTELVYRVALPTKAVARQRVIAWIERYNCHRRHSHCGYRSPIAFEQANRSAQPGAA
jgi:transposase InsO family protein